MNKGSPLCRTSSPELDCLLILTGDIYKKPNIPFPKKIDGNFLLDIALNNKILYHVVKKVKKDASLPLDQKTAQRTDNLKEKCDKEYMKLSSTIDTVNEILGSEYLLFKTYKGYPHTGHDIDILVPDLQKATEKLKRNGFKPNYETIQNLQGKYKFGFCKKDGLLEIELHQRVSWGSLVFVDESILWSGKQKRTINGSSTYIPSPEGEILATIAHMNYQMYELVLGDLLYVYSMLPHADWEVMTTQATKYGWISNFENTMSILDKFHYFLYGEHSSIKDNIKPYKKLQYDLPYVFSLSDTTGALMEKGTINIVKLASYYSVRLKKNHPSLFRLYNRIVLDKLGTVFIKYVYY